MYLANTNSYHIAITFMQVKPCDTLTNEAHESAAKKIHVFLNIQTTSLTKVSVNVKQLVISD